MFVSYETEFDMERFDEVKEQMKQMIDESTTIGELQKKFMSIPEINKMAEDFRVVDILKFLTDQEKSQLELALFYEACERYLRSNHVCSLTNAPEPYFQKEDNRSD